MKLREPSFKEELDNSKKGETKEENDTFNWEDEKREIIESLDKRANILADFEKEINSLSIEDSSKKVEQTLNNFLERVKSSFPKEIQDALKYLKESEEEIDNLYDEVTKESTTKILEIESKNNLIKKNTDIMLLLRIEEAVNHLIAKNSIVKMMSENEEKLREITLDIFKRAFEEELDFSKIKEIRFNAFDILITLDEGYCLSIKDLKNVEGVYLSTTPLIFIRDGLKNEKQVIKHEKTHNLTDQIEEFETKNYTDKFLRRIRDYKKYSERGVPQVMLDRQKEMILRLTDTSSFINDLHLEFVADSASIYPEYISSEARRKIFGIFSISLKNFEGSVGLIKNRFKLISEEAKETKDKDIIAFVEKIKKELFYELQKIKESVERSIDVSIRINDNAKKEVESLFFLLPPSKYYHIDTYLKSKYSEEAEKAEKSLAVSKNFNLKSLKDLYELDIELLDIDQEIIIQKIMKYRNFSADNFEIDSLEDLKRFKELLKKLQSDLVNKVKKDDLKQFNDSLLKLENWLTSDFYFTIIEKSIRRDSQDLIKIYEELNEEEKEEFKLFLDEYIENEWLSLVADWKDLFKKDFNLEEFKQSSVWNFIKQFGLSEKMEEKYNKKYKR